ncbi:N-formylglutamate amidohydrolase [Novosphingobium tardum]|uniref:N-formylglutamate amidohydrolase n=1 Tax=Novosphingobium tardum TaxID=1538021 RepID=A0ABV8RMB9_9SPHN
MSAGVRLLGPDDPAPCIVLNPAGASSFLLVADHAGCAVPSGLGDLGLEAQDFARHIAVDIGVAALGEALSARLDATLLRQHYSRLVIDCNRDPARADAIPPVSDGTPIPANASLSPEGRAARIEEIHAPYHAAIAAALGQRDALGRRTIVVALHSFTPRMNGFDRPWHAGLLYDRGDTRFAHAVLARLSAAIDAPVGDNEPYAMDGIDYTVPHHCYPADRLYAELEIRQDLLGSPEGVAQWAERLAGVLTAAAGDLV